MQPARSAEDVRTPGYTRHQPEKTRLYQLIEQHNTIQYSNLLWKNRASLYRATFNRNLMHFSNVADWMMAFYA